MTTASQKLEEKLKKAREREAELEAELAQAKEAEAHRASKPPVAVDLDSLRRDLKALDRALVVLRGRGELAFESDDALGDATGLLELAMTRLTDKWKAGMAAREKWRQAGHDPGKEPKPLDAVT